MFVCLFVFPALIFFLVQQLWSQYSRVWFLGIEFEDPLSASAATLCTLQTLLSSGEKLGEIETHL